DFSARGAAGAATGQRRSCAAWRAASWARARSTGTPRERHGPGSRPRSASRTRRGGRRRWALAAPRARGS
ncbi:unnamed protein product, partial [Prorocentrum cordatum]